MRKILFSRDCHVRTTSFLAMTAILFPFSVLAVCTPTPDCADMGYTETSCGGKFVRCPFDTSKLFCTPCDSKFQYTCSGDYIVSGEGNSCGNKYISCECVFGATFSNGDCICDTSCSVGNIYYSDGSCSSCLDNFKNPVGVVVKDNELIMSSVFAYKTWGVYGDNVVGLNEALTDTTEEAKADYNGVNNTAMIVAQYGEEANYAATYCYNYAPTGFETSKNKWYLPAVGELYRYVYGNNDKLSATYINHFERASFNIYFWSSTEVSSTIAYSVYAPNEFINYASKEIFGTVACFLAID